MAFGLPAVCSCQFSWLGFAWLRRIQAFWWKEGKERKEGRGNFVSPRAIELNSPGVGNSTVLCLKVNVGYLLCFCPSNVRIDWSLPEQEFQSLSEIIKIVIHANNTFLIMFYLFKQYIPEVLWLLRNLFYIYYVTLEL